MPPDDTTPRVPLGPVGGYVVANLTRLREERRLSYKELSDRLRELGRPIPTLGLSRIEKGTRRVDADDLVALALALGVHPAALLLPRDVSPGDLIELAADQQATARDAWNWAEGRWPLPAAGPATRSTADMLRAADFSAHARPEWMPLPEVLQALGFIRQPVVAAIVTSSRGVLITARRDGQPPWGFVTGESEPGEPPGDTAEREVKEETGLEVRTGRIIGERDHPRTGRHMIYMTAKPVRSTDVRIIIGDEAELTDVRWASLAEALDLLPDMFPPVREHLIGELG